MDPCPSTHSPQAPTVGEAQSWRVGIHPTLLLRKHTLAEKWSRTPVDSHVGPRHSMASLVRIRHYGSYAAAAAISGCSCKPSRAAGAPFVQSTLPRRSY